MIPESAPWYWQLPKHRFNQRAHWHDYTSPCFYMITINRNEQFSEPFSIIEDAGTGGKIVPEVTLTAIGKIMLRELIRIESQYPDVLVRRWVIMPDHLHFVLWVTHKFPYGLGRAVGHFKAKATGMLRKEDAKFASLGISLFAKGFHDR
ncbi:MAG: hypothetical protein K2G69_02410, partial [Muribaculaceae bacterium]|nr:hypothetical protein [Muribaculaceae bacterium]